MQLSTYIGLLAILVLSSCASLRDLKPEAHSNLQGHQLERFNGTYEILSVDTMYRTLPYALLLESTHTFLNMPDSSDWVAIEVIDSTHIQVTLYDDGEIIKEKTKKGSFEHGYFTFKRAVSFPVLWVILNGISERTTRMTVTDDGRLLVDTAGSGTGFFVIVPISASSDSHYGLEFERRE